MAHPDLEGRPFGLAPPHPRLRNPAAPPRTADTAPTAHPGIRRGTLVAIACAGSLLKDQSEVLHHCGRSVHAALCPTGWGRGDPALHQGSQDRGPALHRDRIANGHPQSRLDELLPWAYPTTPALKVAA